MLDFLLSILFFIVGVLLGFYLLTMGSKGSGVNNSNYLPCRNRQPSRLNLSRGKCCLGINRRA